MGRAESGPEFRVNFGSGRVGSFHLWVGSRESDPVQLLDNPNRNPDNDLCKSYFDLLKTGPVVWPSTSLSQQNRQGEAAPPNEW